jgi:hypothetical protein
MDDQPKMNQKVLARLQKAAAPLLEPDETVQYGVTNLTMPAWVYAAFVGIAILPYVIQKSSMAVVTERNVYVLKWIGFGRPAKTVLFKAPLGSVEARVDGSAFPGRYLMIGDQKIWIALGGNIQATARAIAAAASGGTPSKTQDTAEATPAEGTG